MKKFLAITLLAGVTLGPGAACASAGWLCDHFHKHKCHVNLECQQYNAFSPYCCCGIPVDAHGSAHPLLRHPLLGGHAAVTSLPGYAGHASQLPAAGEVVWESSPAPPSASLPGISSAVKPAGPPDPIPNLDAPSQAWPSASSPIFNPSGLPSYAPGFLRYAPINSPGNLGR